MTFKIGCEPVAVKDGSTALPSLAAAALLATLGMAGGATHGQLPAPPPTPGGPALLDSPAKAEDGRTAVVFFAYHSSLADPDPGRREWSRVAPDQWTETYPSGSGNIFDVAARISVAGCSGNAPQQARLSPSRPSFRTTIARA